MNFESISIEESRELNELMGKTSAEDRYISEEEESISSSLHLGIEQDKDFIEEMQKLTTRNKESTNNKRIKTIIFLKESQIELLNPYLKSLGVDGFVYYEDTKTYKTISNLRENLLNEPYWVISTMGKRGNVFPLKLKYNEDVVENYLNHIIVTYNWSLLEKVNKEDYTLDLVFNDTVYHYKVKFMSTLGDDVLQNFILNKLEPIMSYLEASRVCDYLMKNKKKIIENLNRFLTMINYSFDDITRIIDDENKSSNHINNIVKCLATKKTTVKNDWKESLATLVKTYHPNYILKALKNNCEDLAKMKQGIEIKSLSKNYLDKYKDEVDSLDLEVLRSCIKGEKFYKTLLNLEIYMSTPTIDIIKRGGL